MAIVRVNHAEGASWNGTTITTLSAKSWTSFSPACDGFTLAFMSQGGSPYILPGVNASIIQYPYGDPPTPELYTAGYAGQTYTPTFTSSTNQEAMMAFELIATPTYGLGLQQFNVSGLAW